MVWPFILILTCSVIPVFPEIHNLHEVDKVISSSSVILFVTLINVKVVVLDSVFKVAKSEASIIL